MKTGDLVYIHWPHTDDGQSKHRPAMVLEAPDAQGDVQLVKLTGKSHYPGAVQIENSDLEQGELNKTSYARVDRLLTVHKSVLQERAKTVGKSKVAEIHKKLALIQTRSFSRLTHTTNRPGNDPLRPSAYPSPSSAPISACQDFSISASTQIPVPYAGRVFTEDEVAAAVSATMDFWLTLGPEGEAFEKELAQFLGVKHSLLVNSGSSANLVAISALTTQKLPDHKRIRPGDEVITVAAGFPTTVAPILQVGAVAVFIDNNPQTSNAAVECLEAAYVPGKTKAVMMAHALGNPFDLGAVLEFCHRHDLWLIEDNCDALGCTYSMPVEKAKALGLDHLLKIAERGDHPIIKLEKIPSSSAPISASQDFSISASSFSSSAPVSASQNFSVSEFQLLLTAPTGSWGDLSTQSFYPPHHLTMGEGGAVNIIRRAPLKSYAESFRDWGRDCWCPSGKDNTCGKRFGWRLGELPDGYDHKYIYSHLGYNLKPLDPQAAIGRVQLQRLTAFIEARKQNWEYLRRGLADLEHIFDFSLPTHATAWIPPSPSSPSSLYNSEFTWDSSQSRTTCSWFGFMLRVKPNAPFTHSELGRHLDDHKIGNRMLFGGNLLRQPVFVQLRKDNPQAIRVVGRDGSTVQTINDSTISAALPGAEEIMNTALFLGTYPGLTTEQLDYEIRVIKEFVKSRTP